MKRMLCAFALVAVGAAALLPSQAMAQVGVNITIGVPPPPPRYERAPPPRVGYLWAPGYWNWDGRRHVWAGGHWEQARNGYRYDRPQWQHGRNGWELRRGGWQHGNHRGGYDHRRDGRRDHGRGNDYRHR
ncbi:MAG: hypothetical protein ABI171_19025 [Collimonas sp.]|uniref:hypothetical protein n=1 Tax=Collimonas sp. TaxID=1963772 RepID=UPI003264CB78